MELPDQDLPAPRDAPLVREGTVADLSKGLRLGVHGQRQGGGVIMQTSNKYDTRRDPGSLTRVQQEEILKIRETMSVH